ncbi:DUF2378 family protein [Corallococcus sp. CA054B]|uniref:DUF2378 family protein n=1 Tax=Corallococcus sp. CA054B TaxID=2316734 RepID=UPI001F21733B|nr:DUF2378 family protein [Corallococcus sp. CA054B]
MSEEIVYRHAIEGLFLRSVGTSLTPELKARRLGMAVIKGLEHTLLGKALVSLWPIFGPDRVLSRMQESSRAGAKNIRVEPFDFNGHACSYRVRWDS